MLSESRLKQILDALPCLEIAVLGDLFLDRYLDLDAALTELSVETGLDAYQVTRVRSYPGAAGTVINNLAALGVGKIYPLSFIGDDGEGFELRRALQALPGVDTSHVRAFPDPRFRTPTYTKPMFNEAGQLPRELNRLDIKNRTPLPEWTAQQTVAALRELWPHLDALLVLDQVSEADCGVISQPVREALAELGRDKPERWILADSRERIGLFRCVAAKPNQTECRKAVADAGSIEEATQTLARRLRRPVFCTCGERGSLIADPRSAPGAPVHVPAYPVTGPIDIVGAGDSTSAGLACALAAGASLAEAAAFGNLIASITIQQLGTTGTATPQQVRQRWHEVFKSANAIRTTGS
jgi:bifunctional ADP-heptose synthase (sugar kinase/adenylyltransferase)